MPKQVRWFQVVLRKPIPITPASGLWARDSHRLVGTSLEGGRSEIRAASVVLVRCAIRLTCRLPGWSTRPRYCPVMTTPSPRIGWAGLHAQSTLESCMRRRWALAPIRPQKRPRMAKGWPAQLGQKRTPRPEPENCPNFSTDSNICCPQTMGH